MSSERIMNLLVTIPAESRRMNVGKDVIRILGSPAYICILQRKDRQSIAITPCAAEHPMSFKVPDRLLTDGQCRMRINGVQFVQALLEANIPLPDLSEQPENVQRPGSEVVEKGMLT